ncbi:YopJ family acetyltransferase [Candidatus Williamhamiltonella defendens]|uniref:YopJ family acetyltransferase n=1 Tax=Candidatus Williamhamiltonella defendens TaxID=138072 RepID=UPI0006189769|nr:YopJ family acetyltransferase [Candidatus Hamiltonella defensa]CED78169.1 Effector protein yopJ [Candidatus Hamiltonella defensa (Bemisia tabaci)]CED79081.1 Effector protein yopJ [Candidatus Hamiltonella defensa (Bemisia tabaci)]
MPGPVHHKNTPPIHHHTPTSQPDKLSRFLKALRRVSNDICTRSVDLFCGCFSKPKPRTKNTTSKTSSEKDSNTNKLQSCSLLKSDENLENLISTLEQDITDQTYFNSHYAKKDLEMLPHMIREANKKHPGLNLTFVTTLEDNIAKSIENSISAGLKSFRFIINQGIPGRNHCAVMDCKLIGDKISCILFEPASFMFSSAFCLFDAAMPAMKKIPKCYFSPVEMNIQKSHSECIIFSLGIAKKLHIQRESVQLKKMHEDNIKQTLLEEGGLALQYKKFDQRGFSMSFYKHAQSRTRIKERISLNEESGDEIVNKKGETILDRFDRHLIEVEGKQKSVSAHKKRIKEYQLILKNQ